MVSKGRRPEHRRGTVGRPWVRYRTAKLAKATNCTYCGVLFVRDAQCTHPTHQQMPGCPSHPAYPTLEHPTELILGGKPRDPEGIPACLHCNSSRGAALGNRLRGITRHGGGKGQGSRLASLARAGTPSRSW